MSIRAICFSKLLFLKKKEQFTPKDPLHNLVYLLPFTNKAIIIIIIFIEPVGLQVIFHILIHHMIKGQ